MKTLKDSIILYIEDDAITKQQLSQFLASQCKVLHNASDGQAGLALFKKIAPDIVITDIEMPKMNGLEMTRKIREISLSAQIIIITAYKKPEYLLEAVNLQLVQYLIKPISYEKIMASLELTSLYLNSQRKRETRKFLSENQYYDIYTKELINNNKVTNLSKHERALIELFIRKYPAPVSYNAIEANIYDYMGSKNAIKLLIRSLRIKLEKESITNISGFGYKMNLMDKK